MFRFPTRREGFATLVPWLVAPLAHAQFQADPFQPGLRSSYSATAAQAWLPQSVDFVAGGELAWAAGSGTASELCVLSTAPSGAVQPELVDGSIAGVQGLVSVAGAKRADRLFSAAQFVVSDVVHKRTLVRAHDALDAAASGTFATEWVHDLGLVGNGPAKLACDAAATRVVAAMSDANTGTLRVDWIDGANGALLSRVDLALSPLRVLATTNDLSRTALVAGTTLVVLDGIGAVVHQENLGAATYAMALSGDGSRLLVGAQNQLRLLARQPDSSYATAFTVTAAPSELATRAALSADGSTWAVGWWNSITATSIRFELWDGPTQTRTWFGVQSGPAGGLQNYPEAVAVTPDGRRAAFAAWGVGDAQPELLLVDKQLAAPVLAVDLGGSALSLALDDGGSRIAVGKKHVHANQFGATGEFRIYDTGERDLQLIAPPRHGGTLALESRHPGSSITLFAVGAPSRGPQTFPNCFGTFWIDRKASPNVFARPSDAQGDSTLSVPLSSSPSVIGTTFAVQAAARVGGKLHFSSAVVTPVVL
jgi:hypothetical protein